MDTNIPLSCASVCGKGNAVDNPQEQDEHQTADLHKEIGWVGELYGLDPPSQARKYPCLKLLGFNSQLAASYLLLIGRWPRIFSRS